MTWDDCSDGRSDNSPLVKPIFWQSLLVHNYFFTSLVQLCVVFLCLFAMLLIPCWQRCAVIALLGSGALLEMLWWRSPGGGALVVKLTSPFLIMSAGKLSSAGPAAAALVPASPLLLSANTHNCSCVLSAGGELQETAATTDHRRTSFYQDSWKQKMAGRY